MNDLFVNLLLGHLVGDFVLQPKSMAVKKGASNLIAMSHVSIYTLAVLLLTIEWNKLSNKSYLLDYYIWTLIIFIPHYIIDRYSLADKWLDFINGRSLRDFIENGQRYIPAMHDEQKWNYAVLRGGFTALVYAVTDNTFHLLCLWYGYKFLFGN